MSWRPDGDDADQRRRRAASAPPTTAPCDQEPRDRRCPVRDRRGYPGSERRAGPEWRAVRTSLSRGGLRNCAAIGLAHCPARMPRCGTQMHQLAVILEQGTEQRHRTAASPGSSDQIEHRLWIAGRGRHHLQHVDRRGLVFQRTCCSSPVRSRNSPRSRAFSIAITAWAAKFSSRAICLSENGRTSWRWQT